jgi:hypothetical protein
MKALYRLLACAALVAAPVLFAQTTTKYLLGAHPCGAFTSTYYCFGIPFTNWDGSQPNPANANPATVFSDLVNNNGTLNGFYFFGNDELGNFVVMARPVDTATSTPSVRQVTAPLIHVNSDGSIITAQVTMIYWKGTRSNVRPYTTPWSIISGYVEVTR